MTWLSVAHHAPFQHAHHYKVWVMTFEGSFERQTDHVFVESAPIMDAAGPPMDMAISANAPVPLVWAGLFL